MAKNTKRAAPAPADDLITLTPATLAHLLAGSFEAGWLAGFDYVTPAPGDEPPTPTPDSGVTPISR